MAIVTTTVVPELTIFPWRDPGGLQSDRIQPIGELIANSLEEDITLSGTGDTQEIRWTVTLPVNYTYVLQNFSATIDVAAANTWEDVQWLGFQDLAGKIGSLPVFRYGIGLKSEGVVRAPASVVQKQVYRPNAYPSFQQLGGGVWQATYVDMTTEEPAAIFNSTARFLIYRIDQQYDVAVNTPQLIR